MKIIFLFGHPAHYHLYKNVIRDLMQRGHDILVLVLYKSKDVLGELMATESWFKTILTLNREKLYGLSKSE